MTRNRRTTWRRVRLASLAPLLASLLLGPPSPAGATTVAADTAGHPRASFPLFVQDGEVHAAAMLRDRDGRPTFVPVSAPTLAEAKAEAARVPGVDDVIVDAPAMVTATPDPYRTNQWGNDVLQTGRLPAVDTSSQIVAVVDTGVLATHEDFAPGQVLCDRGADFTGDGLSTDGCTDPNGHGTHVAGTVGAVAGNGVGVEGVAQGVRILPVRVLGAGGGGSAIGVASGIVHAVDQGATVINLSLGGPYSDAYDQAVAYARSKDVVVVAAAGNNRLTTNATLWPAASPGAVSVAALQRHDASASFSNSNPTTDISAPGVDIMSLGKSATAYLPMSGTSMAAPHVAAAAALYRAAYPAVSEAGVQQALLDTADDIEATGFDNNTGHGVIDALELITGREYVAKLPPTRPQALEADAGDGLVDLMWPAVESTEGAPVAGYRVYRNGVLQGTTETASYADHRVFNGNTYVYAVSAYGEGGESERSTTVTTQLLGRPATPGHVRVTTGNARVTLGWADSPFDGPAPTQGYRVFRNGSLVATTTSAFYTDRGVANGTKYTYSVTAFGAGGESAPSAGLLVRPMAPRVTFGATTVARGTPITFSVVHFAPDSYLLVRERYYRLVDGVRTKAVRTLTEVQIASNGTRAVSVLPLQKPRRGTLVLRGVDRNHERAVSTTAIRVG